MIIFVKITVTRVTEVIVAPDTGCHSCLHRVGKSDMPEKKLSCIVVRSCIVVHCLERLYRCTKSATDRENWVRFVRRMHARYRERECEYWEAKIARHAKDPKRLWATFNGLLGRHGAGSHSKTPEFSAKDFAAYCESKIGSGFRHRISRQEWYIIILILVLY